MNTTTGKLIEQYRRQRGWIQEKLAAETGLTQSQVSEMENDKLSPTVLQLQHIASALEVHPSVFFPTNALNQHFTANVVVGQSGNVNYETKNLKDLLDKIEAAHRETVEAKNETIKIQNGTIGLQQELLKKSK